MTWIDHFRRLANYNRWANERLFKVCGQLPVEEYLLPRAAYFQTIHGTLQHILVADRLWLGRLMGRDSGIVSLDQTLYTDLRSLERGRRTTDEEIFDFVDELSEFHLETKLTYQTITEPRRQVTSSLHDVLTHLFNHQTHHRGQVHDLLMQTPVAPPPLDYLHFADH
jgi:uncharacterized damage-inducible protein DinB